MKLSLLSRCVTHAQSKSGIHTKESDGSKGPGASRVTYDDLIWLDGTKTKLLNEINVGKDHISWEFDVRGATSVGYGIRLSREKTSSSPSVPQICPPAHLEIWIPVVVVLALAVLALSVAHAMRSSRK
jgi:hypothetical protein